MKKITRKSLDGLLKSLGTNYATIGSERMRSIVGGTSFDDFINSGYGFYDNKGNYMWFSSYSDYSSSSYSYQTIGYVDFANSGYFYLSDGSGGYTSYYNSVYGYGANETNPPSNFLCVFNVLSVITNKSVETLFTEYKQLGYGYNPGIGGAYQSDIEKFVMQYYGGSKINVEQLSQYAGEKKIMATLINDYIDEQHVTGHQVVITGKYFLYGREIYTYTDPSNNDEKTGIATIAPSDTSYSTYYAGMLEDGRKVLFIKEDSIMSFIY